MDGLLASFSRWFSEKTSSSLYFTYIGFFIIWNWKFFQIVFLEKETLFVSPRIEYLNSHLLFSIPIHSSIPQWTSFLINKMANYGWHIVPPAILTYLAIVYLPYLHNWALEKDLQNRFERKRMFETEKREFDEWFLRQEKMRSKILEDTVSIKQEQARSEKKIQETMSDEERWGVEYEKFEKTPSFFKFKQILDTIYKHQGYIKADYEEKPYADAGALAMADTHDIITYGDTKDYIKLTNKGRVFARMYLDKHPLI